MTKRGSRWLTAMGMMLTMVGVSAPLYAGDAGSRTLQLPFEQSFTERQVGISKVKPADLDHIMIDPANPGAIIPCIKILKKFYKKAAHHPELALRILLTYKSNGQVKTKIVVVPVRDLALTDHHPQPADKKLLLVETTVDVSSAPVDPNTLVTGSLEVVEVSLATGG